MLAIPHLSGATNPWPDGDRSQGALLGLSLATGADRRRPAVMEGIAFDLVLTLEQLRAAGAPARLIRAGGGGCALGLVDAAEGRPDRAPVEVVDHPEAGALGAAIGAGLADGTFAALEPAVGAVVRPARRYAPDAGRRDATPSGSRGTAPRSRR